MMTRPTAPVTEGAGPPPIPPLGLGTWRRRGEAGFRAILQGLELGYRHIDTAQTYGTEENIGRAIRASGVPRSEMFVTTKVSDGNLARPEFLSSLERSLDRMDVGPADLTLIHWPSPNEAVPLPSYMEDLAEARARGMTRMIGVSNFPCALVERAIAVLGERQLATNQVEAHPYLANRAVRECCAKHGIVVTAYMPLAGGRVVEDPVLGRIGEQHRVPAATVALAWLLHRGMVAIPASGRREHMESNLRALDIRLDDAELAAIDRLDHGLRLIDPAKAPPWDPA